MKSYFYKPENPLIVQSNHTLLLEVKNPLYTEARDAISSFTQLEKSPEYIHTYSITPLSLWNAAAMGITPAQVVEALNKYSKYPVPSNLIESITELMSRFGKLTIENYEDTLVLKCVDSEMLKSLIKHPSLQKIVTEMVDPFSVRFPPEERGHIKQILIGIGYPAFDKAGYIDGDPYPIELKKVLPDGKEFKVREYQKMAAENFVGNVDAPGGSGVVVLPCGAGKTIVGLYVMSLLKRKTLILVTNVTSAHQWKREILSKTSLTEEEVGEYSGEEKSIKPITIATYQILTYRKKKTEKFLHYEIFNSQNWGLIIYDEVHLLPAPVFKFTAELQARRRLGLTATLVREDGREKDVFTLIGPKKFDVPWKDLERLGWIAAAKCVEIRVDLSPVDRLRYLSLSPHQQIRLAYENPQKIRVLEELIKKHEEDQILIIGQYLSQLKYVAQYFKIPLISGSTPNSLRDQLYEEFRKGNIKKLILSKVGNFAVDLPDANVAIQISGSFGSRQEEAQRLGRILRPKGEGEVAIFYSIVTRETKELDFAMNRQLFLTEQGYQYDIQYWETDVESESNEKSIE